MENNKKQPNFSRPVNSKTSQSGDSKRKTDLQSSKYVFPRTARRRDQPPTGLRNEQQRSSKQLPNKQRPNVDKRPRARGGGGGVNCNISYPTERDAGCTTVDDIPATGAGLVDGVNVDEHDNPKDENTFGETLSNDLRNPLQYYNAAGKRKNLNHLLNFQYAPRDNAEYFSGGGMYGVFVSNGSSNKKYHNNQHKYNKEQFLQANFQFVIKSSAKPHLLSSPDRIIDWALIEQINIQTTEEPRCPICLYPPVAAKLTRCGHAYCWPCILHYLALNEKSWRKCPICYEAVHVADLKSTAILQQSPFNLGDEITFQLMRRKKGSFFVEKFSNLNTLTVERYPQYSGSSEIKAFSKFLLAKRSDILGIIQRERAELLLDEDTSCPEYVFVQQALSLLNERREQLGDKQTSNKDDEEHEPIVNDCPTPIGDVCEKFEEIQFDDVDSPIVASNSNVEIGVELLEDSTLNEIENIENNAENSVLDDVSNAACNNNNNNNTQQKFYYFYQSVDGQNIFLHPLNVKMLQSCYGSLENAPITINSRILQKECHTMDEDLRRKFTCLGHLPLTCQFAVVEINLEMPIINLETLKLFKGDIQQRQMERDRRDREEMKREKKIAAINDRQMGKLFSNVINLNLSSAQEFPACGFNTDLMPPPNRASNSFAELAKSDPKPVKVNNVVTNNVAGTPPGPSYSAVIMANESAANKVNNTGLFPELSFGAKSKKNNNSVAQKHTASGAAAIVGSGSGGNQSKVVIPSSNSATENDESFKSLGTTFGDIMEQAIARKKGNTTSDTVVNNQNNSGGASGKKQKREKKKMVPLFPFGGNTSSNAKLN